MKKKKLQVLLGGVLLFISLFSYAQVPESLSYQAVVRDSENKLTTNKNIGVRISILLNNKNVVYMETHSVTTNNNGLMSLYIGEGTVISGVFSSIDWTSGTYFVKTEIDPSGGKNYTISSVAQLLSVPYALHAKTAKKLSEPVSYNDLIDVPVNQNFSGDYNDLSNKPILFSGKYEDLSNKPNLFSGNYNDLTNKPNLFDGKYSSLTEKPVLFTGNYGDLKNKPLFRDSVVKYGFSGNYNDLINKPTAIFTGNYNDLINKPTLKDSVQKYGFSGNYNDLKNKPDVFNGNYNDLLYKPVFKDSVQKYGFSGNYLALTNKPSIKDSVLVYGSNTNYNNLINTPNIKDSIYTYSFDGVYEKLTAKLVLKDTIQKYGFDGDYNKLNNKPALKDSIDKYAFNGNYEELYNVPSMFDGDYNSLNNRPVGSQTGDILYWEEVEESEDIEEKSGWHLLPRGAYGMVLTIDENGKPAWVNIAQLMSFIADAKYDTIYASAGSNGKISPKGKIAVIEGGIAQFTITPNVGYGIDTIYVDSVSISLVGIDRREPFSYTFDDVDTTHYIHAVFAQKKVQFSITYENVQENEVSVLTTDNDELINNGEIYTTAAGGTISFSIALASRVGLIVTLDNIDITEEVIMNGYNYIVPVETQDRQVNITFRKTSKTYAIGDIYPNHSDPQGIVITSESGGEKGIILHLQEDEAIWSIDDEAIVGASDKSNGLNNITVITELSNYPVFNKANTYGEGWYLPAVNELLLISTNFSLINNGLYGISSADKLSSGDIYWSSTEGSEDYSWGVMMNGEKNLFYKPESFKFRVIKRVDF